MLNMKNKYYVEEKTKPCRNGKKKNSKSQRYAFTNCLEDSMQFQMKTQNKNLSKCLYSDNST